MEVELHTKYYIPKDNIKGCVLIVHGMQEHKQRYDVFANYLADNGFVTLMYDLPGHGKNAKKKNVLGYFGEKNGWDVLVESAHFAISKLHKMYPSLPVWYFGHSMGTIIGRCYLQKYDDEIDGMILSGVPNYNSFAKPGLYIANILKHLKGAKGYSKLLDELMTGTFNKKIKNPKTTVDWLSIDEDNRLDYIKDELCGNPFTIQGYIDLIEGMIQMGDASLYEVKNKQLPIRCYVGEEDPCIGGMKGFEDSISMLRKLGYCKVGYQIYKGKRHELLHENIQEEMMADIVSFLEQELNI